MPNLTVVIIIGQVFLYVAMHVNPAQGGMGGDDLWSKVALFPAKVMQGEVWRLVTFLFAPPLTNLIFAFFFWYLLYLMGTTLEAGWGTFRYNVFLAIGYVASLALAFASYLLGDVNAAASNGFLYGTVFLAFARLYPDFVMYIFFILPVKIRWLALLQWIFYAYTFLLNPSWMAKAMVVASVANYLLFFGREIWQDARHSHRRMKFQARAMQAPRRIVHKCRVCGLASDTAPQTPFRYCSKCDGDCCYCPEHLQNHEHVVRAAAEK